MVGVQEHNPTVVYKMEAEEQSGFRVARLTVVHVFRLTQLIEKCQEKTYLVYVYRKKADYSV